MDPKSRTNRNWFVITIAVAVIVAFGAQTVGYARDIWYGLGAFILFVCSLVLLDIHTIIGSWRKERAGKKLARENWAYAESMKIHVVRHGAPAVQFVANLGLPYAPLAGVKVMIPGADTFRASVEILDEEGTSFAVCPQARNLGGSVYANYPQDFGGAPPRLGEGTYRVRWTNLALSKVIGEKEFEIDEFQGILQSKELRKALKKLKRRAHLRSLAGRDVRIPNVDSGA